MLHQVIKSFIAMVEWKLVEIKKNGVSIGNTYQLYCY